MKVLVISHNSFSITHNNGKTLSSIFSAFSKEELCQLYFTPIGYPDMARCDQYYLITDNNAFHSIIRRGKCGTSYVPFNGNINSNKKRKVKVNDFTRFMRSAIWGASSWYNGGLRDWLVLQRPNIIFYVGGDAIFSHQIAVSLSKKLKLPLVTYFTDDYIINPEDSIYNRLLRVFYKKTVNNSRLLFAIGSMMSDVYTDYYKKPFSPIMNVVDVPLKEPNYNIEGSVISIAYFGGLGLGRLHEIIRFKSFLDKYISKYLTKRVKINIYSFSPISDNMESMLSNMEISYFNGVSGEELKRAMHGTDIFLHVESIEDKMRKLTRLSVSTKIPEYMSYAKPIIAFGPAEVASFKLISKVNPSLVIGDNGSDEMIDKKVTSSLINALNSIDELKEIAHCNYINAKSNFDVAIVAQGFRKKIAAIIGNNI